MREVPFNEFISKAEFVFSREFMMMNHNYLCAVCREKSAVIVTSSGILQPCWDCQQLGYIVIKRNLVQRFFKKMFV